MRGAMAVSDPVRIEGGIVTAEIAPGSTINAVGPLTNTELRASAISVIGPLTDIELRATALPVNGPLTDIELRASELLVNSAMRDSPSLDAFGRQRVSNPYTISEHAFEYNLLPLWFWQVVNLSGSIAHNATNRSAILTVSTGGPAAGVGTVQVTGTSNPRTATFTDSLTLASGQLFRAGSVLYRVVTGATGTSFSVDGLYNVAAGTAFTLLGSYALLRQKVFNLYEKGKSQLIKTTFTIGAAVSGVRKRVGYFSDYNGVYLEQLGDGTVNIVKRSYVTGSIVETVVAKSSWSLDKMDGAGPSGITLNLAYQQILIIDLQFLGAGRIRIGFCIGGVIYYVHEFNHANISAVAPYWQSGSLPISFEIENTAVSAGGTFQAICSEVESEGGTDSPNGNHFSVANAADITVSTTRTHLLSVRMKQGYNGLPNRVSIIPDDISLIVGSTSILVELIYNSTLTGGSWADVNASYSGMEYNTGATISVAGIVVESFFIQNGGGGVRGVGQGSINTQYPIVLDTFGANPIPLTIAATAVLNTSACRSAMNLREVR